MTGGGSGTKLPPPPPPSPTPEDIDIQALEKGEATRKRLRGRKGRRGTILTDPTGLGVLDTPSKGTLLGDTA